MKRFLKGITLILSIILVMSLLFGCQAKVGTVKEGKLVMGTNAQFEPFEYIQNNKTVGIDVEICTLIAQEMGLELEILDTDFNALLDELNTNKCDLVAAGMTVNPEREAQVNFTVGYFDASQAVIMLKDTTSINSKDDLKGKRIAVQDGTTGHDLADEIENAKVSAFPSASDAVLELKNKRVDVVIIDEFPASILVEKNEETVIKRGWFPGETYAIAIKKGNTELFNKVNDTLKKLIEQGKVNDIIKKYEDVLVS